MLFEQGVLPSIDVTTGRLLLEDRHLLAVNPDGHGGSLRALAASGALEDMSRRGVTQISYFQVDNPLVQVLDAPFIGAHVAAPGSSGEMSSKMVVKSGPGEKVGVFARSGGRTMVIEYSDLPAALAEQKDADGRLRFRAGSIAVHVLSVDFVHRLTSEEGFSLPLHRALKKVPCIDPATGASIDPHAPNAIKLETFIFDAIPMARCSIVVETDRTEEFGPIKNATGGDSPATSHALQTERAARWLERTGVRIPRDAQGCVQGRIEISPLSALSAEDVRTIPELPASIAPGRDVVL